MAKGVPQTSRKLTTGLGTGLLVLAALLAAFAWIQRSGRYGAQTFIEPGNSSSDATHDPTRDTEHAQHAPSIDADANMHERLVDAQQRLDELAKAGDANAATKLFRDTVRCLNLEATMEHARFVLSKPLEEMSEQQAKMQDDMLNRMQQTIEATKRLCDGTNADDLDASVYPAMLRAARLGDLDAAVCYIGAGFNLTPEEKTSEAFFYYQENALSLAENGIERGDWRMVGLMSDAYSGGGFTRGWFAALVTRDKKRAYAYTRLLRIGAEGDYAERLDRQLAAMAQRLSKPDIETADRWAQEMFQQYFQTQKHLTESPGLCNVEN